MGLFDNPLPSAMQGIGGSLLGSAVLGPAGMALGGAAGWMNGAKQGQGPQALQVPDGQPPGMAPYQSISNPDGTLKTPYQVNPGKLGDTSAWQKIAQDLNSQQTQQGVDAAQAKAQGNTSGAWAQLAQNGGLQSGARERIAAMGDRDAMMASQGARQAGANNALGINLQGEQMNRAGDQFNIQNDANSQNLNAGRAAQDVGGQNQYNQNQYNSNLQNWTGMYNANAMQNAYANQPKSVWQQVFGGLF